MSRVILIRGGVSTIVAAAAVLSLSTAAAHASKGAMEPATVSQGVGEWRVGPSFDPDCDFQDIQDAIDATVANDGGFSTINIRVAGGTSVHEGNTYVVDGTQFENITTVRIIGGHTDCSGSPFAGARTILDAAQNGRVFLLSYDANDSDPVFTMELENLEIRNGLASFAGGGIRIQGHAGLHRIRLDNVEVHSNETTSFGSGGGISLEATDSSGGPTNWFSMSNGSSLHGNVAAGGGGGMACFNTTGLDNPPILLFKTTVAGNQAVFNGGGFAVNGCRNLSIRTDGDGHMISLNSAGPGSEDGDGGALHANNGARITLEASGTDHSAIVFGNSADRGGGIAVQGNGTEVNLVNTLLETNTARTAGGGLYVHDEGQVVMGRQGGPGSFPGTCEPLFDGDARCSALDDNVSEGRSAALAVESGGDVEINQTRISGNVVQSSGENAIDVVGENSMLQFEGLMMHGQQGVDHLFGVEAGTLRVRWSTIAGNDDDASLVSVFQLTSGIGGQPPQLNVDSSIVWEPSVVLVTTASPDATAAADCVIGHMEEGISGFDSTQFYSHVDPRLRDRYIGDLRLRPDSPAIDYCDDGIAPAFDDFFNRTRGIEYNLDPDIPPVDSVAGGLFDLGAFEQPLTADVLHADRFEASP